MRKVKNAIALFFVGCTLCSCAAILGGPRTAYQTTKPKDGGQQRQVRVGYVVADVLLTGALGIIIDFATGAIYKPAPEPMAK